MIIYYHFNVLISNRDDYAKKLFFQWVNGSWKLSPAYDLLPSNGFNGYYTTTINGKESLHLLTSLRWQLK